MEISQEKMEELASLLVSHLRCPCGLTLKQARSEPCMCGWTPVSDWFDDNCGLTLKIYRERLDAIKRDWEYFETFGEIREET